jgi:hypothetical protein
MQYYVNVKIVISVYYEFQRAVHYILYLLL